MSVCVHSVSLFVDTRVTPMWCFFICSNVWRLRVWMGSN